MRALPVLLALLVAVLASGCGSQPDKGGDPGSDEPGASAELPTGVPAAEGEVATRGLVTVLDAGDGPQLCLGGVAESFPPQCSGPELVGWTWAELQGWQRESGVRWGEFAVTGTWDGERLSVTDVVPAMLFNPGPEADDGSLETPCPEPEGGWQVRDEGLTTSETLDATLQAASALEGFAAVWLDGPDDPTEVILNVAVTEDPAGAEERLRETWGGKLCVTEAARSESELNRIGQELQDQVPGLLAVSGQVDTVGVDVIHDDESIQAWADATYGAGVVRVVSALTPAEG